MRFKNSVLGTLLAVQWLRICLPMQGTQVRSLVWKDPTSHRATTTKPLWPAARAPPSEKPAHCSEDPAQPRKKQKGGLGRSWESLEGPGESRGTSDFERATGVPGNEKIHVVESGGGPWGIPPRRVWEGFSGEGGLQ